MAGYVVDHSRTVMHKHGSYHDRTGGASCSCARAEPGIHGVSTKHVHITTHNFLTLYCNRRARKMASSESQRMGAPSHTRSLFTCVAWLRCLSESVYPL